MNILYVTGYRYPASLKEPLTSGDLRYSFTLSRALAKLGHTVNVVTRLGPNDRPKSQLDGVNIYRYKSGLEKVFSTSFDISLGRLRLFKRLQKSANIIICNSPLSLENMVNISAPIIYVASGLEDVKNYSKSPKEVVGQLAIKYLRDPLKKLTWRRAGLVNTTAWHEDNTIIKWGVPKAKVGRISSGVDTSRFKPVAAEGLRSSLKLKPNEKVVLSVSRFTPAKGIIETIKAFDMLNRDDTRLVIVGVHHSHDNSYYSQVVQAINKSANKKRIVLLENIPEADLPKYYSVANVTSVFSKGYDPLPTVIIESMACGTPVVSTYFKTREQFIDDGKTGLFVAEGDLGQWAKRLNELLNNKKLENNISRNGLKLVEEKFDWLKIAKEYLKDYE